MVRICHSYYFTTIVCFKERWKGLKHRPYHFSPKQFVNFLIDIPEQIFYNHFWLKWILGKWFSTKLDFQNNIIFNGKKKRRDLIWPNWVRKLRKICFFKGCTYLLLFSDFVLMRDIRKQAINIDTRKTTCFTIKLYEIATQN